MKTETTNNGQNNALNVVPFLNSLSTNLELSYVYEDGITFNAFENRVECFINEQDIIYYSVAIEYLSNNDNSLKESLNLASEFGLELSNLNSEVLATLLLQDKLRSEFNNIYSEIEDFFNKLNN